jgi:hypothetical protein
LQCGTTTIKTHTVQSGLLGLQRTKFHYGLIENCRIILEHQSQASAANSFLAEAKQYQFQYQNNEIILKHFRLRREPLHYKR